MVDSLQPRQQIIFHNFLVRFGDHDGWRATRYIEHFDRSGYCTVFAHLADEYGVGLKLFTLAQFVEPKQNLF